VLSGILASAGIAFGKVLLLKEDVIVINQSSIEDNQIDTEINRFLEARSRSAIQLESIQEMASRTFDEAKAAILESLIMLLKDEELEGDIKSFIKTNKVSADRAIHEVIGSHANMMAKLNDPYLRERATDYLDTGSRLIKNALGIPTVNLSTLNEDVILVATDLTPSEAAQINLRHVRGIVTDFGSHTTHTAIIARSLGLPAIVGTNDISHRVKNGDMLLLDAINNKVVINPSAAELEQLEETKARHQAEMDVSAMHRDLPAITQDGHQVKVCANISTVKDTECAIRNGAEGMSPSQISLRTWA
jgi:phosphotransferase system enzyme I (PtsI)